MIFLKICPLVGDKRIFNPLVASSNLTRYTTNIKNINQLSQPVGWIFAFWCSSGSFLVSLFRSSALRPPFWDTPASLAAVLPAQSNCHFQWQLWRVQKI